MISIPILIILFISITLHEYFHGLTAYRLGDPTAKLQGRLTLNPLAHIDPFGTILLPLILLFVTRGGFAFGYAKPVPVNPYHFKNPKRDMMWVALSGPGANFAIALILSFLVRLDMPAVVVNAFLWGVVINLILAFFNLMPIPPLDGSRIVAAFLPHGLSRSYLQLGRVGFVIIPILIFIGFFEWGILPLVRFVLGFLGLGGVM